MHFVNPRDNSVMDVGEILRIIDYRTEMLDPLFREFNVLNTVRFENPFIGKQHEIIQKLFQDGNEQAFLVKAATSETVIILWMAGIIVFLCLILAILLSLCIHQKRKFARRLKAAMAAIPSNSQSPGKCYFIQVLKWKQDSITDLWPSTQNIDSAVDKLFIGPVSTQF